MQDIKIAHIISENRKLKGITQDELANYIGVSKAAVSKWENGQSYPDITFLPHLATYFNISIDELMGYEPQMTKEDIRNLYLKLSKDFTIKPFEDVVAACQEIIKKYFSCYPLLFQVALLLLNNSNLATSMERAKEIITEAKSLFVKVKNESNDVELAKQALHLEGLCLITLGSPGEVIALLDDAAPMILSSNTLLAKAYQMIGNVDQAKKILQVEIYQYFLGLLELLHSYLHLFFDDKDTFDEISKRYLGLADLFNVEDLHPTILLPFYLTAAQGHLVNHNEEEALACLESYCRIATGDIYPLKLKGDDFFTSIDEWFETFAIGTNLPRDEKVVKQSMLDAIVSNPIYKVLEDNVQFRNIVRKLKLINREE